MRRYVQVLLIDPDADFRRRFKREVEGVGRAEVAICSLGRNAALLAGFIQFDAVFASAAAELRYEVVSERIRKNLADSAFYVYGVEVGRHGDFLPLSADAAIATAQAVVLSHR